MFDVYVNWPAWTVIVLIWGCDVIECIPQIVISVHNIETFVKLQSVTFVAYEHIQ